MYLTFKTQDLNPLSTDFLICPLIILSELSLSTSHYNTSFKLNSHKQPLNVTPSIYHMLPKAIPDDVILEKRGNEVEMYVLLCKMYILYFVLYIYYYKDVFI